MIFFSDCMPERFAGYTIGPIALIRPSHRNDLGLIAHEKCHIDQFWRNPFKSFLAIWIKDWKLELEVEAYKVQMQYTQGRTALFAEYLATKYGLDITAEEAEELLK
jgi:hypothetical protein